MGKTQSQWPSSRENPSRHFPRICIYGNIFKLNRWEDHLANEWYVTGWWFQFFLILIPICGRFPFWLIFFKGVGNHQLVIYMVIQHPSAPSSCCPSWWTPQELERCTFRSAREGSEAFILPALLRVNRAQDAKCQVRGCGVESEGMWAVDYIDVYRGMTNYPDVFVGLW